MELLQFIVEVPFILKNSIIKFIPENVQCLSAKNRKKQRVIHFILKKFTLGAQYEIAQNFAALVH